MAEPGKLLFVTQKSENKLRQLVGAPNTTDYSQDGTANSPQQSIRRKDTNTATAEATTEYQGMFHLGVETETVNGTEKVYLTVDWPESNSSDPTLVGKFGNNIIYYINKIELTKNCYICLDYYYRRIIVAEDSELPPVWNGQISNKGLYISVLGRYESADKNISQLWKSDNNDAFFIYELASALNHYCFLELDVDNYKVKAGKLYLNIVYEGSSDRSIIGYYEGKNIPWSGRKLLDSDCLVFYDPFANQIRIVKNGEKATSKWVIFAYFRIDSSHLANIETALTAAQVRTYEGEFAINYDIESETVSIKGGHISVNNTNYYASDYVGALTGSTLNFYIRHRVAQSATSGDEDPDLTEQQKQALRTTIANCDSAISTATQAINGYQQQITALQTQRTAAYNAISAAYSTYNNGVSTENNRHTSAVNAENRDYNQKVSAEDTLNKDNLATLKSTYDAGVTAENRTHQNNLNNLDPSASDYDQKVAAENARHAQVLANLLNTYNTDVTAENTRHNNKLQELLTAHNTAISTENSTHAANINTINTTLNTTLSAQNTIISGLNNQIATQRGYITTQQGIINTQTQAKNAACLQLYGVIPSSSNVEIVALPPGSPDAQTDQYLFIYIGQVKLVNEKELNVSFDEILINQAYQGSIMAFYRMDTTCGGLLS